MAITSGPTSPQEEVAALLAEMVEHVTAALAASEVTPLVRARGLNLGSGYYELLLLELDPWRLYTPALELALPVYLGAACGSITERARHHERTLTQVTGIGVRHIGLRWVELDSAAALAVERRKLEVLRPIWNDGGGLPGFGSRPPGRGRPGVIASWFHSLHRGHPAFEAIPRHRDPDECRKRVRAHFDLGID